MPKINWNFSSLFSEISKRFHHIHLRSRRPSSRMAPTQTTENARPLLVKLHFIVGAFGFIKSYPPAQSEKIQAVRCYYCQKPCRISNYYYLEAKGQLKGWKCDNHAHPVEYIAIPDATYYAFMFTLWSEEHEYSVEGYKLPQGEQWELREGSSLILHFDYIPPNLTPDNIDGRLKTLIVFS